MTLRAKITAYFVALHVVIAVAAIIVLIERPVLLFAVEALFILSIVISYRLVRALFVPLDLLRTGAELINERDFSTRFTPVGQPEMDDLIAVYNKMIDRLREERLTAEEQHQLLGQIVQASPSGIIICDFEGNVERTNPAAERLLGYVLPPELRAMAPGESRLLTVDGSRRLKVWRAEFRDRGFSKSFFLIEEMTEELRLSEKAAYEKLIRMMSHEVNNSVGSVRSLLDSILRYSRDVRESDRADFTSAVTVASSRMDALNRFMHDLAEVVRIPAPRPEPVRVGEVVRGIASLLRPELEGRDIELEVGVDPMQTVDADRAQLEQVVLNVVRNAVEAVGREGRVCIRGSGRALAVADSGPGVAESIRADLFSPFFSTRKDGRGLGLTIVQEILTNHGFTYALENRPEGGAEFRISW
ncbi:MAG TPA: ATP-binding protein [Thermoanaerobaculia bacterium]|nr:ATP-binding protein [Thermoanaerobaculia bacterium]